MGEPPRPVITVQAHLPGHAWVATFHGNRDIIRLFGTDTVPLPFTLHASGQDVRKHVERLYPHAQVRLIDRDGTLLGQGTDPPGRDRSAAHHALPWYRVPGTSLSVSLYLEDTPPSLCLGLGLGDETLYGGCDAHDAGLLADAIERRRDLTLHATGSGRAQAQVRWVPDTLTVAAHDHAATRAFPDPRARAALCAVLRLVAQHLRHSEDAGTDTSTGRCP